MYIFNLLPVIILRPDSVGFVSIAPCLTQVSVFMEEIAIELQQDVRL